MGPEGAIVTAGEERKFEMRAKDKFGNYCNTGGAKNVSGKLTPQAGQDHSPQVFVKDLGNGTYEVKHVIEKTGPYKLDMFAGPNNKNIGNSKVKCIPAAACGKNSVASGDGIAKAKVGM
jgi:hypothetical protein